MSNFGDPRLPERFWSKCIPEPNSGCWFWIACVTENGYGHVRHEKKIRFSHRVTYATLVGEVTVGLELDHLCRNTLCCNPSHLEPVTHAENVRRGNVGLINSLKTHCRNGHPYEGDNVQLVNGKYRRCRLCRRLQRLSDKPRHLFCANGHLRADAGVLASGTCRVCSIARIRRYRARQKEITSALA